MDIGELLASGVHVWRGFEPFPGAPYIADVHSFDVPETMVACIRNAAPGLVAITASRFGGAKMIAAMEAAAADRGISILWFNGPDEMQL